LLPTISIILSEDNGDGLGWGRTGGR